jgi:hypothetical protein
MGDDKKLEILTNEELNDVCSSLYVISMKKLKRLKRNVLCVAQNRSA